jgi:formamidopyrimidine-DNA glycosylase
VPELPELEAFKEVLAEELNGKTIERPHFLKPHILKAFPPNYEERFPAEVLGIDRRGKYLHFSLDNGLTLYIHLMKSGRIGLQRATAKPNKFVACSIHIDDGRALRIAEYGKEKMARFYMFEANRYPPGFERLGIEPLDPSLTAERLADLLRREKRRLKQFLTDQHVLAGIGNAYANEILWNAKLSPFSVTASLGNTETAALLSAMHKTLKDGIAKTSAQLKDLALVKVDRQFMAVHGKKDEPCPRCGDRIRWVYARKNTTYYCPTCQTGGKILKDRRTSKFLK